MRRGSFINDLSKCMLVLHLHLLHALVSIELHSDFAITTRQVIPKTDVACGKIKKHLCLRCLDEISQIAKPFMEQ